MSDYEGECIFTLINTTGHDVRIKDLSTICLFVSTIYFTLKYNEIMGMRVLNLGKIIRIYLKIIQTFITETNLDVGQTCTYVFSCP